MDKNTFPKIIRDLVIIAMCAIIALAFSIGLFVVVQYATISYFERWLITLLILGVDIIVVFTFIWNLFKIGMTAAYRWLPDEEEETDLDEP